jgi:hypothetical protein
VSRTAALLLAALPLAACAGEGFGPSPVAIAGTWTLTQVVSGGGASCSEGGSLEIQERGATFEGSFATRGGCDTATGSLDYRRDGGPVDTFVNTTTVRFRLGVCSYEGAIAGEAPRQVVGQVTCTSLPGITAALSGTFEMHR